MCVGKRAAAAPARPLFVRRYVSHRPFALSERVFLFFWFFFSPTQPAHAKHGDISPGRRHRSNKQLSLPFTLPAILWPHSTTGLSARERGEKKKSIAGINVAWTHRRVGYYTCKKLLEAAPASSLVLCAWWSRYEGRRRQLHYAACNEYLSIYLYIQYICII